MRGCFANIKEQALPENFVVTEQFQTRKINVIKILFGFRQRCEYFENKKKKNTF